MRLRIERLKPGMQVAQSVVSPSGQVLLEEGMSLSTEYINALFKWGISSVDVVISKKCNYSKRHFLYLHQETIQLVTEAFEKVRIFKEVPIANFKELVENYVELLLDMSGVVANLSRIRSHNEYTFNHSLNVAILCGLIGKWLGYSGQVLKDLILAGLLHDIGKALTPLEILNKPGKLTMDEMEVIKLHPVQGYNLVSNREDISDEVKIGILQHHERLDGSGYPLGLSKDAISNFSCIISIADMYDAMTAERVYRKRMSPFSAAETIIKEMYNKLDPNISLIFLTKVQSCLIGSRVLLSNGKIGKVLLFNNDPCTRPIVKLDDDTLINLEKNRSIEIVDLIEERKSR